MCNSMDIYFVYINTRYQRNNQVLLYFYCRIWKLKDTDIEKMYNKSYIESQFIYSVGALGVIILIMSGIVLWRDWGRIVFVKGLISFIILYFTKNYIIKGY